VLCIKAYGRFQWPRGLRRGSAAFRLLGLWVRVTLGSWMSVSFECCVLSGGSLCVGLITRPEESYRLWCVSEFDHEASIMRRAWPRRGCCAIGKKKYGLRFLYSQIHDVLIIVRQHICTHFRSKCPYLFLFNSKLHRNLNSRLKLNVTPLN
jgi:hypothetical protein